MSINKKSDVGYFLEVDLEYPNELHELHNDYLLAPEKLVVSNNVLSAYCKKIANQYDIKVRNVKKYILILTPRKEKTLLMILILSKTFLNS